MFDKAQHECMRPTVAFQIVYLSLLDVADITYSQATFLDWDIKREELSDSRLVVQGGKTDVLAPIVGEGHLIIRLSIFRRKHQP